ncbi:PIN domain-containing protein [Nonomuraea sp. NPDC049784]|uniref:PIN domain-containing protein n=1 Tax=Nonomuraea sp. NPDC049784 TaxID=3154361 RepID=UPI0033C817B2
MIVLLDANVLIADPFCSGIAWKVLALGAPRWKVKVKAPKAALLEAVASYQREIGYALEGLDKWQAKYGRLQLKEHHASAAIGCKQASEEYASRLSAILSNLQVEVVDIPEVPLTDLVNRATRRQRPCDQKGDGFRDTLNWLTVMKMAADNPGEKIAWVSNDTGDFADESGQTLHPALVEELTAAGLANQVIFVHQFKELALTLAKTSEERLAEVRKQLQDETLRDFIRDVLQTQVGKVVERHRLGLAVGHKSARISAISRAPDSAISIEVKGEMDGGAIIEFVAHTNMKLRAIVPQSAVRPDDVVMSTMKGDAMVRKARSVEVTGLITVDAYQRPTTAEITRVTTSYPVEERLRGVLKSDTRVVELFNIEAPPVSQSEEEALPQLVGSLEGSAAVDLSDQIVASMPEAQLRALVAATLRAMIDPNVSPPDGWELVMGSTQRG